MPGRAMGFSGLPAYGGLMLRQGYFVRERSYGRPPGNVVATTEGPIRYVKCKSSDRSAG